MKLCLSCRQTYASESDTCSHCGWSPVVANGFTSFAPEFDGDAAGFRPEYFAQLAALEADNFWFRARNELIGGFVRRYFPRAKSVLEVGCGTGFVLSSLSTTLPQARLHGSEIYTRGLEFAQTRVPRASLMQMDARRIPYRDEFDLVGAFDVIEHIEEDERVLAELHGALRPGGGILVTVPQHPFLWSEQDVVACHVRRYRRGELERKLIEAGFTLLRSTSFVSLLLPLLALSRLRKRGKDADFDPMTEFRIPRSLNAVLYAAMKLESLAIGAGVSFPVGGTRLVAATKAQA